MQHITWLTRKRWPASQSFNLLISVLLRVSLRVVAKDIFQGWERLEDLSRR